MIFSPRLHKLLTKIYICSGITYSVCNLPSVVKTTYSGTDLCNNTTNITLKSIYCPILTVIICGCNYVFWPICLTNDIININKVEIVDKKPQHYVRDPE